MCELDKNPTYYSVNQIKVLNEVSLMMTDVYKIMKNCLKIFKL